MELIGIYNDIEYKICPIDHLPTYKKEGFELFRRLFVELVGESKELMNKSEITKQFCKFGDIESIQIRNTTEPVGRDKPYAYVTFTKSIDAHKAVDEFSIETSRAFKVEPANTWHQPKISDSKTDWDDNSKSIATIDLLNDDCLQQIFEFCDVHSLSNAYYVSQRFRRLLQRNHPKYKSYSLDIKNTPLSSMRKILSCIGGTIVKLEVRSLIHTTPEHFHRILYKIAQYVNRDIEYLTINHLLLTTDVLTTLRPLLNRIKMLRIWNYNEDFEYDVDLREFCPNLVKLKVKQNMVFVLNSGPWNCLENLSITGNQYMVDATFEDLCCNNPHLKRLSIQSDDTLGILSSIHRHLHDLEKLTIYSAYPSLTGERLSCLTNLKKLAKMKLRSLEVGEFVSIIHFVSEMKELTYLELDVNSESDDEEELIDQNRFQDIANNLTKLKVFHVSGVTLSGDELTEFIKKSPNLEEFIFTRCLLKPSTLILQNIIDARTEATQNKNAKALRIGLPPNCLDNVIVKSNIITVL